MTPERLAEIEKYFQIFSLPKQMTDSIQELIDTVKEQKDCIASFEAEEYNRQMSGWDQSM